MAVIRGLSCSREISFGGIWPRTRFTRYERLAAEQFPELAASIEAAEGSTQAGERRRRKASLEARRVSHGHLTVTENRLTSLGDRSACRAPLSSAVERLARSAPELLKQVASGELSVTQGLRSIPLNQLPRSVPKPRMARVFHVAVEGQTPVAKRRCFKSLFELARRTSSCGSSTFCDASPDPDTHQVSITVTDPATLRTARVTLEIVAAQNSDGPVYDRTPRGR